MLENPKEREPQNPFLIYLRYDQLRIWTAKVSADQLKVIRKMACQGMAQLHFGSGIMPTSRGNEVQSLGYRSSWILIGSVRILESWALIG